jgi:hypothetical protein
MPSGEREKEIHGRNSISFIDVAWVIRVRILFRFVFEAI